MNNFCLMLRLVLNTHIPILKSKFDQDLRPNLLAFKAARYFSPSKLRPTAGDLDSLKSFPFFDQDIIDGLKSQLPSCFAAAEDVCEEVDVVGWWKGHKSNLPNGQVLLSYLYWSSRHQLAQKECYPY